MEYLVPEFSNPDEVKKMYFYFDKVHCFNVK